MTGKFMTRYVHESPAFVDQALDGIELNRIVDRQQLGVATDGRGNSLNILARDLGGDRIELYGICIPASLGHNNEFPPVFMQNVNALSELPSGRPQHIDRTGEGVGARLYNTRVAASGSPDADMPWALYGTVVDARHIHDARKPSDATILGKIGRIASHAGKILGVVSYGAEETVRRAESRYPETSEAVILNQPPYAAMRQIKMNADTPPPTFAIIRHSGTLFRSSEVWQATSTG